MKVSLISTDNFIVSHGLRTISAYLKSKGYNSNLIFLPSSWYEDFNDYQPNALNYLIELLRDSDIIGISSMAISSHRTKQVAHKIKKSLSAPLIWGGIYATTSPEECIQFADMVCIGEGEDAVLELMEKFNRGDDYFSTKNFWFKNNADKVVKNGPRPLRENLDELPFADYELETQYILKGKRIISAREYFESNPDQIHGGQILIHTARGCPYSCAYCTNRFLNDLYRGKGSIIRRRSFKNAIEEIIQLRKKFPLARSVFITDDVFFLRNIEELEFFSREYSLKVGLPFQCYGAPPTIKEDKLKIALKGGLNCVVMGVQTGSERLNRNIYKRLVPNEIVLKAAKILNKYREKMVPPTYQFIISNPYETADDLIETIQLLKIFPKPYILEVSNLIFFPGCELYKKAIGDGLINNSQDENYNIDYYDDRKHLKLVNKNIYLNTLIYCMEGKASASMIGSLPISFIDFFVEKRNSRWVRIYWFTLLGVWRLRYIYIKTSTALPINLRKALSRLLKNIFIFIGSMLFKLEEEKRTNKTYNDSSKTNVNTILNKAPKVSVIIPTHNHAHFLPECLASVKNQTYQDYEVIVVNNGSTDNTEEVIKKLSWDKLRYHYQNDSGSVAGSRNTGIRLARGEYVAFLDSDDLWYEKKIERVLNILQNNPGIDIISHDLYMSREGKRKKLLRCGPLNKDMVKSLLLKNRLFGSATMVKKSVMLDVNGFSEDKKFIHVEDCEAWLRIAYLGKKFYFINEILGEYRVHSFNLSNDFECVLKNAKNIIDAHFKKVKSIIPFYCWFLYTFRLSNIYFKFAVQYFFRKKYLKSIIKLFQSILVNPFSLPFNIATFIESI